MLYIYSLFSIDTIEYDIRQVHIKIYSSVKIHTQNAKKKNIQTRTKTNNRS